MPQTSTIAPPAAPAARIPAWRGVAAALALTALALALSLAMRPFIGESRFLFFYAAVSVAAWYGGRLPGILCGLLSVVAVDQVVGEIPGVVHAAGLEHLIPFAIFVAIAVLVSSLADAERAATRRAEAAAAEARRLAATLEENGAELQQQVEESQALAEEMEQQVEEAQVLNEELEQVNEQLQAATAELERARDAESRTRRELAAAFDAFRDLVVSYDRDLRVRFMNDTARARFAAAGLDPDRMVGRVVTDELPRLRGSEFEREARRAMAEQRVTGYESPGSYLGRLFSVRIFPDADGGVTAYSQDVTEEREVQRTQRLADDRLRALVRANTEMVWVTDPEGLVDDMPFWRELTGQTLEQVRGSGWVDAIHPDDRARTMEIWREALRTRRPYESEYRLCLADGSDRWFRARGVPVANDDGTLREWVGIFNDIDAERRAMDALREERAVVDALNEVGRIVASELDLETAVQAVTDAATRLSGAQFGAFFYNVHDAGGESYTLYTISGVPREAFSRFPMPRNTRVFGPTFRGEGIVRSDDITKDPRYGHSAPYHGMPAGHLPVRSYLAVPVTSRSGEVLGGIFLGHEEVGVFGETGERLAAGIAAWAATAVDNARLYEAQRHAREEAEEANRVKFQFLTTMSHELRTPLNAIAGYTELIEMGVHGPTSDAQREALRRVRRSQQHLLGLINDVLNFAKIESGTVTYDIADTPIGATLAEVEVLVAPQMRAQSLVYEFRGADAGITVRADAEKVRQIVVNLLSNAVKFTEPGGRVSVECEADDERVHVRVRDSGIGIAPDKLETIFSPFVQIDRSFTRNVDGTGLGLSISRELARAMGGELTAESEPGAGTTFTLSLPRGGS